MPTHFDGSPDEIRALSAYINLIRASDSLAAQVHQHLGAHGLTDSQFGVLEALLHLGPQCQRALADKLLKSGGNITLVIDNLEKQQLVTRQRNAQDRRYITVTLTDRGRALIESIFPAHAAGITRLLGVLSPDEQQELRRLCRKLGRQERQEHQPAQKGPAAVELA